MVTLQHDLINVFRQARSYHETGWGLELDADRNLVIVETTYGDEDETDLPVNTFGVCHTHPIQDTNIIKPPSPTDLVNCVWSWLCGQRISLVCDDIGIWIYGPNQGLVEYMHSIVPSLDACVSRADTNYTFHVNDAFMRMIDVIKNNTTLITLALTLSYDPERLSNIMLAYGEIPPDLYPIDLNVYRARMERCVRHNQSIGFHITFHSYIELGMSDLHIQPV